jgi:hypothetical protein
MDRMHEIEPTSKLGGLLAAYRQACPDPEPSSDFMPRLWQKIEARRMETTWVFKRFAQACVAATALALVLITTVLTPAAPTTVADNDLVYTKTYTEVLAADNADRAYIQVLDVPGLIR